MLQNRSKYAENRKGEKVHAAPLIKYDPQSFNRVYPYSAAENGSKLTNQGTEREKIIKNNPTNNSAVGIVLAAVAALLCAVIDYYIKENNEK